MLFRSIEDYYRTTDLFILPSQNEGMPNVVLEAMSCGLPCVVTRISGTTDLINHGESGVLFDVNSEASFLAAMDSVIRSQETWERIGSCARTFVMERYSAEKIADRYLQLYQEILNGKS